MSTSRHIIRLEQVSYQIRGEIVSTLAEAGLVRLWEDIRRYLPETNLFSSVSAGQTKLSGFPNVSVYDSAFLNGSILPIIGYLDTLFPIFQIKNELIT